MEQFARRPLTRRHYFPQHTAFLLREGTAKFGHGKSPSPQTTLRSEKENRPGSTCQSKIAKLLGWLTLTLVVHGRSRPLMTWQWSCEEPATLPGSRRAQPHGAAVRSAGCIGAMPRSWR